MQQFRAFSCGGKRDAEENDTKNPEAQKGPNGKGKINDARGQTKTRDGAKSRMKSCFLRQTPPNIYLFM
jgi:hypothetical protein